MRNNKTELPLAKNLNLDYSHKAHKRQRLLMKQTKQPLELSVFPLMVS